MDPEKQIYLFSKFSKISTFKIGNIISIELILPAVGLTSLIIALPTVVSEPLSPTKPKVSPDFIDRFTPSTASCNLCF